MKRTKTSKAEPADILTKEDLDPKNVKAKISAYISEDVLHWLRDEAEKIGVGYQTFMQMKLREAMEKPAVETRLERIERELFKKRA